MVLHLPGAKGYSTKMGLLCAELLLLQIGHDQPFTLFKKSVFWDKTLSTVPFRN